MAARADHSITMTFDLQTATETVAQAAREHATAVDANASFPAATIEAARSSGLLALTTATTHGGHGRSMRDAGAVIERVARECGSSAMVMTMHYAGNAVIEAYGRDDVRKDVAAGKHLSTLAFSEAGSRSHFWAPTSTAKADGEHVTIDADKSWITSANHATAYVWSSRPSEGDEASTLWLVPGGADGLTIKGPFDGLGLRGNDSAPVQARGVKIPTQNRLGDDGAGFGIMMQTVLPTFSMLISAGALGLAEALVTKTCEHVAGTNYAHMPEQNALRDLPTIRAYVARMRIQVDMAKALWQSTFDALEQGREDAPLKVLETKAAAADTAAQVADIAMRVCGGMAFRKEVGVERMFRDTRASLVMAPTSDQLYDFVGKAVTGLPLF